MERKTEKAAKRQVKANCLSKKKRATTWDGMMEHLCMPSDSWDELSSFCWERGDADIATFDLRDTLLPSK